MIIKKTKFKGLFIVKQINNNDNRGSLRETFNNKILKKKFVFEYYQNKTYIRSYGAAAGSGEISFRTGGGGGSLDAEAMRINGDGHVTQPNIPHFHAVGAGAGGSQYFASRYIGDNVRRNNGNHYSTASNANKFTAPVAGVYAFSGGCLKYSSSTVNLQLRINGSPGHATDYAEGASGNANCTISAQVYLNANDYVQLFAANGNWYDNGPGTSDYNWFSGCLIG